MLVLGGVYLPAQSVGRLPEDLGAGEVGVVCLSGRHQGSILVSFVAPYPAESLGRCSGGPSSRVSYRGGTARLLQLSEARAGDVTARSD